ncbi:hypothetical protein ES332_D02G195000v1 [Gossypium tomentosum]|uniref:Uncharacterized protein n=1 Tax=Gossypium tomentosum TaxID=34277 RepID=A0A5D2LZD4_GOSTO|nr:hypothetical protein ES332_D02G195000v1 [Gossypium tomentosum]
MELAICWSSLGRTAWRFLEQFSWRFSFPTCKPSCCLPLAKTFRSTSLAIQFQIKVLSQ